MCFILLCLMGYSFYDNKSSKISKYDFIPKIYNFNELMNSIARIIFSIEGIFLVFPLRNTFHESDHSLSFINTYKKCMVATLFLYVIFGMVMYNYLEMNV